jgi:hypothetical protein
VRLTSHVNGSGLHTFAGRSGLFRRLRQLLRRPLVSQVGDLVHELPRQFQSFCESIIQVAQLIAVRHHFELVPVTDMEMVQEPAPGEEYRPQVISTRLLWGEAEDSRIAPASATGRAIKPEILLRRRCGSEGQPTGTGRQIGPTDEALKT